MSSINGIRTFESTSAFLRTDNQGAGGSTGGLDSRGLVGPRPRGVEEMPAGGAETERLQELL